MEIPYEIQTVLDMLIGAGYEAWLVGGCTRNTLMGIQPKDFDITTSALPDEIKSVFGKFPTVDTGIAHGTVTVIVNHVPVEITTYRTDGKYSDNRRPDSVSFTLSLEEDLKRRDFTVNAICYSPKEGYVDLFGGMDDIKNMRLKAVGNADDRFKEDALRILRALRFASKYGFEIDAECDEAIKNNAYLLQNIAAERITAELTEILCGDKIFKILMDYFDVFKIIIPEIVPMYRFDQRNKYHKYDLWEHTCHVVEHAPNEKHMRLAALLHDIGKPPVFSLDEAGNGHFYGHAHKSYEMSEVILNRLKLDKKTSERVLRLVRYHDSDLMNDKAHLKRMMNRLGDTFLDLLDLKRADTLSQADRVLHRIDDLDKIESTAREILNENECFSLKTLALDGNDLMAMGYAQGIEIGNTLDRLLNAVINGEAENTKEALKKYLEK